MKLLGWMHRKFRQNSIDPLRDFGIGNACNCLTGQPSLDQDQQQCYLKPNYGGIGNKSFRQQKDHQFLGRSFAGLEASDEVDYCDQEEDRSSAITELFHGFLAIGTLGNNSDTNNIPTHPSTPTFGISSSVENITEQETEVTENELKLINDELEKVLGAEAIKEDASSGRNSHVSNGRSSHGSTITLTGKQIEGPQDHNQTTANGFTVCPLQGYLFGSAIELSETTETTTTVGNNNKKEQRTSLGELFQRTKLADHQEISARDHNEKRTADHHKEADKSAVHIVKKMLKKKPLNASRTSSVDSVSAERKLHKILQMFNRKVHPESSSAATKKNEKAMRKHQQDERRSISVSSYEGARQSDNGGHQMDPADEDIVIFPHTGHSEERIRRHKSQSNPPQFAISSTDSNGNREFWIKTDADYLVLEL